MHINHSHIATTERHRGRHFRRTLIACFRDEDGDATERLQLFSERDWEANYGWLDATGLALYLLQRLNTLERTSVLPPSVLKRLQQNATDNFVRMHALVKDAADIRRGFENQSIRFALLKGFSLAPLGIPDPALRIQLDLDFLVATEDIDAARQVLVDQGYRLDVVSGDTWEFKTGEDRVASIEDLYKVKPQKSVELHLVRIDECDHSGKLDRLESRSFYGEAFPVLSPVDLFLNQALHVFGHICGPFTRISWLLEYRYHVLQQSQSHAFWKDLASIAADQPRLVYAIGVVTAVAEKLLGVFAPPSLRGWTVDRLSRPVSLWIEQYGSASMLAAFPGTKLYLLLQSALGDQAELQRSDIRKRLLPLLRPRMISHGTPDESVQAKTTRYFHQFRFLFSRLSFHVFAGLRYSIEILRWRRIAGVSR